MIEKHVCITMRFIGRTWLFELRESTLVVATGDKFAYGRNWLEEPVLEGSSRPILKGVLEEPTYLDGWIRHYGLR